MNAHNLIQPNKSALFFFFIWTGNEHNTSLSLLNLSYTVTVFFISFFFFLTLLNDSHHPFPPKSLQDAESPPISTNPSALFSISGFLSIPSIVKNAKQES